MRRPARPASGAPGRRTRTRTRATAAASGLLAGVLLLAGCSGGGDSSGGSTVDAAKSDAEEAAPGPGAAAGKAPAESGAERDDGSRRAEGKGEGAERDGDTELSVAPPPMLSTFALDVDTASYTRSTSLVRDGVLPDPSEVRPEEFVNSFPQGYPQPDGDGFWVGLDGARTDVGGRDREDSREAVVRIGLSTREMAERSRPPAALTVAVDVSGSMSEEGRLDLVRYSLDHMAKTLKEDDSVALVAFDTEAETVLPMTRVGGNRDAIREAVDGLRPGGGTNVGAGVEKAYEVAGEGRGEGRANRVVLLSDALANTGETDPDAMVEMVEEEREENGIALFGVGVGSEYGDELMERLTNRGDGHTTYISSRADGRRVFGRELASNVELRARDAKAQVAFYPGAVEEFTLIGYENRKLADEDFRNDRVDGGEVGPGHTVTALYAVRLTERPKGPLARATVRWQDPQTKRPDERSHTVDVADLAPTLWGSDASPHLRVSAVAADYAQALRAAGRGSPKGGDAEWSRVNADPAALLGYLATKADGLAKETDTTDVRELAKSIREAERLAAAVN